MRPQCENALMKLWRTTMSYNWRRTIPVHLRLPRSTERLQTKRQWILIDASLTAKFIPFFPNSAIMSILVVTGRFFRASIPVKQSGIAGLVLYETAVPHNFITEFSRWGHSEDQINPLMSCKSLLLYVKMKGKTKFVYTIRWCSKQYIGEHHFEFPMEWMEGRTSWW